MCRQVQDLQLLGASRSGFSFDRSLCDRVTLSSGHAMSTKIITVKAKLERQGPLASRIDAHDILFHLTIVILHYRCLSHAIVESLVVLKRRTERGTRSKRQIYL